MEASELDWSSIPTGGPVDVIVPPMPIVELDRPATFTLMAPGWRPAEALITQSLGFCFTAEGKVVLVSWDGKHWTLPGGTVEPDEDAHGALVREFAEEACGRVLRARYLACQHVWDPGHPDGRTSHYQSRWWARVELGEWRPEHEIVERRLVEPADVVATLFWHGKALAARLLELACEVEAAA
jgi:ADP-ribose pyrophosphatase YjhB (NUDIX family)